MDLSDLEFAEFQKVGDKAVLFLNRPPLNILTQVMCNELIGCLKELERSSGQYDGLLITTKGKHFCAGADIKEHLPGQVEKMLPEFNRLMLTLAEFPLPIVAAVSGACLGGGMEFVRACRQVILWEPETVKLAVPEIKLACFPPFGIVAFPRFSDNLDATIRFILTGQTLRGKMVGELNLAFQMGLYNEIFKGSFDQLIHFVDFSQVGEMPTINSLFQKPHTIDSAMVEKAMANETNTVASLSAGVLDITKTVLLACAQEAELKSALSLAEEVYLQDVAPHPDYERALTAFLESQKP